MLRRHFFALVLVVLCVGGAIAMPSLAPRIQSYVERRERSRIILPPAQKPVFASSVTPFSKPRAASTAPSSASFSSAPPTLPSAVNWDVPFTSQAPFAVWDALHEEACEEASILMVLRYFRGETIESPAHAEAAIQSLVARGTALGFTVDLTAAEARLLVLDQDPSLSVRLLERPGIDELKAELTRGALIIVPAAGQQLRNPYFQRPGPRYHMLVLRGYTMDGHVITNDPGTKRGEAFAYTWDRVLSAVHDWNGGDVDNGIPVVLSVAKQ